MCNIKYAMLPSSCLNYKLRDWFKYLDRKDWTRSKTGESSSSFIYNFNEMISIVVYPDNTTINDNILFWQNAQNFNTLANVYKKPVHEIYEDFILAIVVDEKSHVN